MKKFISLTLAMLMVCSMGMTAFAADSTTVTYVGQGTEAYTVTVPASMNPGDTGTITVKGTWPTTKQLSVSAPDSVTLTCDIDGSTKTLDIDYDGLTVDGSNTTELNETETISVGEITDAIFGTWTGTITYTISMGSAN